MEVHTVEVTILIDNEKTLYTTSMEGKTDEQIWKLRSKIIKDTDFIRGNVDETHAPDDKGSADGL